MKRAEFWGYVRISRYKLLYVNKGLQPTVLGMFYDRVCAPCMSRAHLLQATVKSQNYK
jgi:hypothetical protein